MHRRDFLGIMGSGLAGLLLPGKSFSDEGVVANAPEPERVTAGNLWIYDATNYVTDRELKECRQGVVRNFEDVGIEIQNSQIVRDFFPELSGLDVLIYLVDEYNSVIPSGLFGIYDHNFFESMTGVLTENFRENSVSDIYSLLRNQIGFPYSPVIARENTGIIPLQILFGPKADRSTRLRELTNYLTHETAHRFWAMDVDEPVTDMMYNNKLVFSKKSFSDLTIRGMKDYIKRFRAQKSSLSYQR